MIRDAETAAILRRRECYHRSRLAEWIGLRYPLYVRVCRGPDYGDCRGRNVAFLVDKGSFAFLPRRTAAGNGSSCEPPWVDDDIPF
jgi:hypothetical protein